MFHVILYQPEIPPNTGNIIRLCANTGCQLHLVRPLGFTLEDRQLKRAGLDYHEFATLRVHDTLVECLESLPHPNPPPSPLSNFPPQAGERTNEKSNLQSFGEGVNVSLRELVVTRRVFALTTKGSQAFHQVRYQIGDAFLFGPESRGLPPAVLDRFAAGQRVRLPMLPHSRSLNLSNAAAVVVFEAWRQCGFVDS
ncbi:MAG TPA: tRNA (cytidine(34)-2'-O)-methyltransferase [Gallionella sp.]|jgi:tRNA (cytidine/uridine-2'-O-)-methyltransferase|nr:tRNA (cytidine(34)-2'-O)-methyltransferase [Gallionella sp.]